MILYMCVKGAYICSADEAIQLLHRTKVDRSVTQGYEKTRAQYRCKFYTLHYYSVL